MTLWTGKGGGSQWTDRPTWYADTDISKVTRNDAALMIGFQDVLDLARMHWNWLKITQPVGWETGGWSMVSTTNRRHSYRV